MILTSEFNQEPQPHINKDVESVLANAKVRGSLEHARDLVTGVSAAETIKQQIEVFTHSPIFDACKVLNSPEMDISSEEAVVVERLNTKLLENPQLLAFLLGDGEQMGLLY